MTERVIIGLEAHDGTGKTETSLELLKLFGGERYWVKDELKKERREILQAGFDEKCKNMDDSYRIESQNILAMDTNFVVMDRTWASHAAERYYEAKSKDLTPPYQDENWPDGILKPNITFQLKIPDDIRVKRVLERAEERDEELSPRDNKLNEDSDYRRLLEIARNKLGCIAFFLRERDPLVASLRAAQVILGSDNCPPMKVNLDHLNEDVHRKPGFFGKLTSRLCRLE